MLFTVTFGRITAVKTWNKRPLSESRIHMPRSWIEPCNLYKSSYSQGLSVVFATKYVPLTPSTAIALTLKTPSQIQRPRS